VELHRREDKGSTHPWRQVIGLLRGTCDMPLGIIWIVNNDAYIINII
jgi:hypothetical protein